MTPHLIVLFRYALTIVFSVIGGALMSRGLISPEVAGLLIADPFIEAAAALIAAALPPGFYLFFSQSRKANTAWAEVREAEKLPPVGEV